MNCSNILSLKMAENWGVDISLGPIMWLILMVGLAAILIRYRIRSKATRWDPVEIVVPFVGGKVKIVPNYDVLRIAHQAWTEIITRKAGLEFEEDHDVIVEVYNSWYDLFKETRSLIKTIPAHKLRESRDARQLVTILVTVLNEGLRPHLTRWQARFRRWYAQELERKPDVALQEIQREYSEYQTLVNDLKRVNSQMVDFAKQLQKISQG